MSRRPITPHLTDIIDAIGRVRSVLGDTPLATFETDWQKKWLIERGIEIISESIGNVRRHDYESISAPVLWSLVRDDLLPLDAVYRGELACEIAREQNHGG